MAKAIDIFEETFQRAWSQVAGSLHVYQLFKDVHEENKEPVKNYNETIEATDIARFGIVIGVAAMDDYFTRKYADVLVPCIKKKGVNPKMVEMLEGAGLNVAGALDLLAMERPFRRIRKLAQDYYKGYATHSIGKIDALYATLGISKLSEHSQRRAKRQTLIQSVESFVKRRHQIVHGGDLNRRGNLQPIDMKFMKKLNDIELFVRSADLHIDAYLKQKR
jgi:hypothetical protein